MDWMMTFSPRAFLRLNALESPTAIIDIGMAASKTCPTFNPRNAAAAEKMMVITRPMVTDHTVTSG